MSASNPIDARQVPGITVKEVPSSQKGVPQVVLGTTGGSSFLSKKGVSEEHQAMFQEMYREVYLLLSKDQEIGQVAINLQKNSISYWTAAGKQVVYLNELKANHELVKLIEPIKPIAKEYLNSSISSHRFGGVAGGTQPALSKNPDSTILSNLPSNLRSFLKGPEIPFYLVPLHLKEHCSKPYFHSLIQSILEPEKRPEAAARVFAIEKYYTFLRERLTALLSEKRARKAKTLPEQQEFEKEIQKLETFLSHLQGVDLFAIYWANAHFGSGAPVAEESLKETFRTTHRYRNGKKEELDQRTPKGEYARDVGDLLIATPQELHARLGDRAAKTDRVERFLIQHLNGIYEVDRLLAFYGISSPEIRAALEASKTEAATTFASAKDAFAGCTKPAQILAKAKTAKMY